MKFSCSRALLFKPLQAVTGVVERRQTMPILGNILLSVKDNVLTLTTTDTEIELITQVALEIPPEQEGAVTVPARKFSDICKSLPDDAEITCTVTDKGRFTLRSGHKRFVLATLPAEQFPNIDSDDFDSANITLPQKQFLDCLKRTAFAMAQQDVRLFLNGMLMEINPDILRTVATDGHRLALSSLEGTFDIPPSRIIIPRKTVLELLRLMSDSDDPVTLSLGTRHTRVQFNDMIFTSKLLEGSYPDYNRVIPDLSEHVLRTNRDEFKQALHCASILSNEQYKGVKLGLQPSCLHIQANNPEQEEAKDEIEVDYQGEDMVIGFNVNYLMDVLSVIDSEDVSFSVQDTGSSALITSSEEETNSTYVVMPIRL